MTLADDTAMTQTNQVSVTSISNSALRSSDPRTTSTSAPTSAWCSAPQGAGPRSRTHLNEVLRQVEATAFPKRVDALAGLLVRERVDLVGLQEVCTWSADGDTLWDFQADLLAALETAGDAYDVVVEQSTFRGAGEVARRSDGAVTVPLSPAATWCCGGGRPTWRSWRPTPACSRRRSPCAGGRWRYHHRGLVPRRLRCGRAAHSTFVNTHTEAYDAGPRNGQRAELRCASRDDALVVVGDFNATPTRSGCRQNSATRGSRRATRRTARPGDLLPARRPGNAEVTLTERIDYVWVRDVAVRRAAHRRDPEDRTRRGCGPRTTPAWSRPCASADA